MLLQKIINGLASSLTTRSILPAIRKFCFNTQFAGGIRAIADLTTDSALALMRATVRRNNQPPLTARADRRFYADRKSYPSANKRVTDMPLFSCWNWQNNSHIWLFSLYGVQFQIVCLDKHSRLQTLFLRRSRTSQEAGRNFIVESELKLLTISTEYSLISQARISIPTHNRIFRISFRNWGFWNIRQMCRFFCFSRSLFGTRHNLDPFVQVKEPRGGFRTNLRNSNEIRRTDKN